MATVTGLTAARMLLIEAASVIGGYIDEAGHLILETFGGSEIDAGYMLESVPAASETVAGIVELATEAEATAGTDDTRAITPAGLSAAVGTLVPAASETVAGKVELATLVEAVAGTDSTKAITPEGVAAVVSAATAPDATTTVKGVVELATTSEAITGTDTVRAVTPAGLDAAIMDAITTLLQDVIYPVGSIYTSYSVSTSPATILGFGTWSALTARVLIGVDGGTYTAGGTGGAETHTIASGNLPTHTHDQGTLTVPSGGNHTHTVERDFDGASGAARWTFHSSAGSGGGQNTTTGTGAHTHTVTGSTGNGGFANTAINHMPPWRGVYMWRRTA